MHLIFKSYMNQTKGFTIDIDVERKMCLVTGKGEISFEDSTGAMNNLIADARYNKNFPTIVDLRMIDYHPTYREFKGIRAQLLFIRENFGNRVALITSGHLASLGQLICFMVNKEGMKMKFFDKYEDGEKWACEGKNQVLVSK